MAFLQDDPITAKLSSKTGSLERRVGSLNEKYKQLWSQTATHQPGFQRSYSRKEQKEIEKALAKFLDRVMEYASRYSQREQEHSFEEPIDFMTRYMEGFFQWVDLDIPPDFTRGIVVSTQGFMEKVGAFDDGLSPTGIYQALRNIWICNTLQLFLDKSMNCSDPLFAYSMLYPYTDNLLDDHKLTNREKLEFIGSLGKLLEGEEIHAPHAGTMKWSTLVSRIEKEFPREIYPRVYQSLLSIYNAQLKSLNQHKTQGKNEYNYILDISFEKGGSSVLADGFLISGELTESQEDFCYGLGTFLQLADDIQDIYPDSQKGHQTIFSIRTSRSRLDEPANHLFNYIPYILAPLGQKQETIGLFNIFMRSFHLHIMEAIGKNRELYSRKYVNRLQTYFPVSFSYIKKLRKKLLKVYKKQVGLHPMNMDVISAGLLALTARLYEK